MSEKIREIVRQLEIEPERKEKLSLKMQAFHRLEMLRKQTIPDMVVDYDKELAEVRNEKYG